MRKLCLIILIFLTICLTGCVATYIDRPETNLEFWIGDNVTKFDFSNYQVCDGGFGSVSYYGTGYEPIIDEDGNQTNPEYYVIYRVSAFPDYASSQDHITSIEITDPAIELYGLTINSTEEEIKTVMKDKYKFNISKNELGNLVASKKRYKFIFEKNEIYITVKVTNVTGRIY